MAADLEPEIEFQSTPPVREATAFFSFSSFTRLSFQSTPPVREATPLSIAEEYKHAISIHASREGGDAGGMR